MAIVEGVWTCSALDKVTLKAQSLFADGIQKAGKQIYSETINAVKANQTAKFAPLEDTAKIQKMKVYWTLDCLAADPDDCTNSCEITGDTLGSDCKDYEITTCKEYTFGLSDADFTSNLIDPTDVAAEQLAQRLKLLDEYWNKAAIAFLKANAGTNVNSTYPETGGCTHIPAINWNSNIMIYLDQVGYDNEFGTNVMATGYEKLRALLLQLKLESNLPQSQADLRKLTSLYNIVYDGKGFAVAATPETTLTWNGGSVAFVHRNYYTPKVVQRNLNGKEMMLYSVPSPTIAGVNYDVIHSVSCDDSPTGRLQTRHDWKVMTSGAMLINPLGCVAGRTGILCFDVAA